MALLCKKTITSIKTTTFEKYIMEKPAKRIRLFSITLQNALCEKYRTKSPVIKIT
jgi:hypothetical protein